MDGKIDNIIHAAAAVITIALSDIRNHNEVQPRTVALLTQARNSLKSLCPECVHPSELPGAEDPDEATIREGYWHI